MSSSSLLGGCPLSFEMDRARLFALEADVVPLVESSVDTESRELDGSLTDEVRGSDILVPALDFHVVTDVLDVNVEHLVPLRGLASTLHSLGLELLHASLNRDVWVHFAVTKQRLSLRMKVSV